VEDYPRNRAEFEARFSTETVCREYLVKLRWPDGFRCSRCGGRKSWPVPGILLQCAGCGPELCDSGDDLPGHAQTADALVSDDGGCGEPEERC